ncbi:MAG TPA: helix-turn-helix domain-containing protein, partial [Pirellulales bacterium]
PENTTLTPPILCNLAEAARLLAVSDRKVWGMANKGELPCVRVGRCLRFRFDDLREWTVRTALRVTA